MIRGAIVTCSGSSHSCHGELSRKLFFLDVQNLSEEMVLTSKNVKLRYKKATRFNNNSGDQVSLMCYARNGATPTDRLFDYSGDISKAPLVIKLPRLGTWYFYIVPIRTHGSSNESGMHPMPQLCHSLHWEVFGCPSGKAGPNCSWERYTIEVCS